MNTHFFRNACTIFIFLFTSALQVNAQSNWKASTIQYIEKKLSKADGGYGWEDQPDSHTTVTFAVTGTLFDLNELPQNKAKLAEFIRTHHPQRGPNKEAGPSGSDLRNLTYEQIQAILWLGGNVSSFADNVSGWKSQAGLLANYEEHKYAVMYQEAMIPICQKLVNVPLSDQSQYVQYFQTRRRANGSFNNAPASTGGDGNILNTYWSLYALNALDAPKTQVAETVGWLQNCQLKNGGFTHQPNPQIGVNDDVIYIWAGIKALQLLGAKPKNTQAAINYLTYLLNADGGFGDRPGLHSTPVATYYAIDALKALNSLSALDNSKKPKALVEPKPDFTGYKVFTVQYQGSGNGSPKEAVMLADSLHIQLWGVKYPAKGWVAEAQRIADQNKVSVTFFIANEPHDNELIIPGMGSFNHILDYFAPAKDNIHFNDSSTYDQLKRNILEPLKKANGGLMLQVSNNEPLARILLDESINSHLGYMAISTIHFGQNFAFWLPYLMEYRYRLPLVTLQDAHGIESWWWADELTNHRNVFIAKEPTYEAMVTALKNNWIAAIRHDSISNFKTRMLGGTVAARKFISAKEADWKWWNDGARNINRPWAAMTLITKNDSFEVARPATGVNVRIRCWWNSIRQALKNPIVVLEKLTIDNAAVKPEYKEIKNKRGGIDDSYYLYFMEHLPEGKHVAEATIRNLKNNEVRTIRQDFFYSNELIK